MGDRHLNSSHQGDSDLGRQHVEQSYIQTAITGTYESSTFIYPLDNFTVEGEQFISEWNSAPVPVGYSTSNLNAEFPHYHWHIAGQSHDSLAHASDGGSSNMVRDHVSSSNHGGQLFQRIDGGPLEPTVANNRGRLKRRSPSIPVICERGSTSRYFDAGSSSDHFIPSNPQLEKPNSDSNNAPWSSLPFYRGSGLSIDGEGNSRNVRSRPSFDLENNLAQARFPNPPPQSSFTMTFDNPISTGFLAASSAPSREWNPGFPSPASLGRNTVSDPNLFGHETSHFNAVNGNPGASVQIGGHVNNSILNRNAVTQTLHDFSGQHARGVRSSYVQGTVPNFRAASSNLTVGNMPPSDQGTQFAEGSHGSQYPRLLSTLVLGAGERNGRNRISSHRYRTTHEGARFRDRLMNEVMIAQHSAINASRSLYDQHREMRLDIDNMSYEELLALVERIGSVNTGLSDDLIPKCLTELIYCSSDHVQDEGRCVICLDEYKHMDDIGTLKKCGHDFHVQCIRKWLSIKNLCPICKATALDDSMKNK